MSGLNRGQRLAAGISPERTAQEQGLPPAMPAGYRRGAAGEQGRDASLRALVLKLWGSFPRMPA